MGHAHDGIYNKHYQNDVVEADIVSAVLEKPSDNASMRLLGHVALTRDPNAPTKLTSRQRLQVLSSEAVQVAKAEFLNSTRELRRDFGSVTKARKQFGSNQSGSHPSCGIQERVQAHDRLYRVYRQIVERAVRQEVDRLRADYFER